MKKVLLAIFAVLLFAIPASAQVQFGVKGGLNLSKFSVKGGNVQQNINKDNETGFFIGPMVDLALPIVGFGIDAALLYNQIDAESAGTYKSIEIPVNAKFSAGLGRTASIFFAAGPQFGFNLNDDDFWGTVKNKSAIVSANVGAGVKLFGHLQAGVNYNMPITKTAGTDDVSLKTKSWQISVAYMF